MENKVCTVKYNMVIEPEEGSSREIIVVMELSDQTDPLATLQDIRNNGLSPVEWEHVLEGNGGGKPGVIKEVTLLEVDFSSPVGVASN